MVDENSDRFNDRKNSVANQRKKVDVTSPRVRWKIYSNSNNFNDAQMDSDVGSEYESMLGIIAIHAILGNELLLVDYYFICTLE